MIVFDEGVEDAEQEIARLAAALDNAGYTGGSGAREVAAKEVSSRQ